MLVFITSNIATILVGAVVLGILAAVTVKLIRDKRRKKSSCGCSCDGCSGCESAAPDKGCR